LGPSGSGKTTIALLKAKRYLYVGFMLHQTIEKAFKAYYVYLKEETPPFIHSLFKLSQKGGFYDNIPENLKNVVQYFQIRRCYTGGYWTEL